MNAASSLASEAEEQLDAMENAIQASPDVELTLLNDVLDVKTKLMDVMEKFNGDPSKSRRNESDYLFRWEM